MSKDTQVKSKNGKLRTRFGIAMAMLGFALFLLGAKPELFNLDRSNVIGFVQITVFLFGLAVISAGGYIVFQSLWNGKRKSIAAEIGMRLVGTGYVIALASGMADVLGLGTRPLPNIPFFGYWQARGVLLGEIVIIVGFAMMIPFAQKSE